MDQRLNALNQWTQHTLGENQVQLHALSNDAGHRRYFRLSNTERSLIAVDAPPQTEKNELFILISTSLARHGLNTPQIIASQLDYGFMLISDLGDQHYLQACEQASHAHINYLYTSALQAAVRLARCQDFSQWTPPPFDKAFIQQELDVFKSWFLERHCKLTLTSKFNHLLQTTFEQLITNATEQPQVSMHRDYHSRNLMVCRDNNPGILDFQDMVTGPITYDVVSLLKDCYKRWSPQQMVQWAIQYYQYAQDEQLMPQISQAQYLRWFDFMGLERHLKVLGTFARLNLRDKKPGYLTEMPRITHYIIEVCERYPELTLFRDFVINNIKPNLEISAQS